MPNRRKERKKKKYLGTRSFGRGNVKNGRGAGQRGGRGKAGICKHKWSWAVKYSPGYFHKHGFSRPVKPEELPTINLFEINQLAIKGKLKKSGDNYYFEWKGKVLGTGNLTHKVDIKAFKWSKRVEEKLKQSGSSISQLALKQ